MIEIISNGSKWAGESPDPIEKLFEVLQKHPLDRTIFRDRYFQLSDVDPTQVTIHGNFCGVSHVFRIRTNESTLIQQLVEAIAANVQRKDYLSQIDLVTLWWIAESRQEVEAWREELKQHEGCIVYVQPACRSHASGTQERDRQDVILNLPRSAAIDSYRYTDKSLEENDIGISLDYVLKHVSR